MILQIALFVISILLLMKAAGWLVRGISLISEYLRWKEFVIAFFIMALGGSAPNLFIGISSAFHGIPELSFGDMIGNSIVDMTLVVALAVFLGGTLSTESRVVQRSVLVTMAIAILPLLLIVDGELGRGDGIVLWITFLLYSTWLFSKRKLFSEEEEEKNGRTPVKKFREFLRGFLLVILGILVLMIAAEGVVRSASVVTDAIALPVALFGILVTGVGNSIPELYFAVVSARKKQNWIVMGELLGSVAVLATVVIGTVAIIHPIVITDFAPFALGRAFLILAAMLFLIFTRTSRKITKAEALVLVTLYVLFVAAEILLEQGDRPSFLL